MPWAIIALVRVAAMAASKACAKSVRPSLAMINEIVKRNRRGKCSFDLVEPANRLPQARLTALSVCTAIEAACFWCCPGVLIGNLSAISCNSE